MAGLSPSALSEGVRKLRGRGGAAGGERGGGGGGGGRGSQNFMRWSTGPQKGRKGGF